ncbi:hypothetical protein G6F60_014335 [Rhizopus arrhizus]|nr:hypothetical protein G6F60_014335 [Rhizopus arrhizus]
MGVSLFDVLSLDAFRTVFAQPNLMRAIVNSVAIGVFGGALAVMCYMFVGLAMHRKPDNVTRFMDYSVLVPRAVPGLLAGLAFLWVFLTAGCPPCRSRNGCARTSSNGCAPCAAPSSACGWPIPWCGWPTACA